MKTKQLTILLAVLFLLVSVFLTVCLINRNNKDSTVTDDSSNLRSLIRTINTDKVTEITLPVDDVKTTFTKKNGKWFISGDEATAVNDSVIEKILDGAEMLLSIREIGEKPYEEYGLDKPSLEAEIVVPGERIRLLFGNKSDRYDGYYFTADGRNIQIVDSSLKNNFEVGLSDVISLPSLPRENIISFSFQSANGAVYESDSSDANLSDLLSVILSADPSYIVGYGKAENKAFGMDNPATAKINYKNGDSITVLFGLGDEDKYIYISFGKSTAVFVCDSEKSEELTGLIKENQQ